MAGPLSVSWGVPVEDHRRKEEVALWGLMQASKVPVQIADSSQDTAGGRRDVNALPERAVVDALGPC